MKIIAMIPARYKASRFPGKLMQDLCGLPVIVRTYQAAKDSQLFDKVCVVTDSDIIAEEIKKHGGNYFISQKEHESGSDRIAEAAENINADIIVNIQGDEPFINKEALSDLLDIFRKDTQKEVDLATLMEPLKNWEDIENPNNVKVITNIHKDALYFSRAPIPYPRDKEYNANYYKHIGIYAYRKEALLAFTKMPISSLERTERLEQLRYLENGFRIRLALTNQSTIGIDTPEDLEKARNLLNNQNSV